MKRIFTLFFAFFAIGLLSIKAQTASYSATTNGVTVHDINGNTPISSSALFEVRTNTKGMLPPRLTTTQIDAIVSPVQGLMAYDTDLKCMKLYNGVTWDCLNSNANIGTTPLSSSYAFNPVGNSYNEGNGIAVDSDNNIYVAGNFQNTITFGKNPNTSTITSAGGTDIYLVKYNSDGELIWINQIGGTAEQVVAGLVIDTANNIYLCGSLYSTTVFSGTSNTQTYNGNGYQQSYIAKYSSAGALAWYSVSSNNTNYSYASTIAIDVLGNIYLGGNYSGSVNFGASNLISNNNSDDLYITKLNSSTGAFLWATGAGGTTSDRVSDIAVDGGGNIYITGYYTGTVTIGSATYTSRGAEDIFVAKYNTNGAFAWAKTAGTTSNDYGDCIAVSSSGADVYFLARFNGTLTFGPGLGTNPIIPASPGYPDMLLAKFDTNGNYSWATYCGNSSSGIQPFDITLDPNNNSLYFTGKLYGTMVFRSINTPSTFQWTSCSGDEPFIAKYSSNGVLQWAIAATGCGNDVATKMTIRAGTIYTTGSYNNTINFAYQQLPYTPNANTFVWRYSE